MRHQRGGLFGRAVAVLAALLLAGCSTLTSGPTPPPSVALTTDAAPTTRTGPAPGLPTPGLPTPSATPVASSAPTIHTGAGHSAGPGAGAVAPGAGLPGDEAPARLEAARALVTQRLTAQARGSRADWLSRVSGATLRSTQGTVFDRMASIGIADLRLVTVTEIAPPPTTTRADGGTWDVRATFDYGIRGFQTAPRSFSLDLRLKASPRAPETALLVGSQPVDRPQPWDLDGLRVRRSASSLVLGAGPPGLLDDVRRRADEAHERVAAVWGSAVPSVVIVPATDADAAGLLGVAHAGLAGVAAVTDGPLTAGRPAGADRVVIIPGPWRSLTATGRDVVLTHELTHVAVRATTTRAVPLWLSEGFAEYVAYRRVRLPESSIVAPLLEQVRRAGLPAQLPDPAAFAPASGRLAAAYGEALCAVRTLVDLRGEAAVVRGYRAAAGGLAPSPRELGDAEAIVDGALLAAQGLPRSQLESEWRTRIATLAGVVTTAADLG